MKLIKGFRLSQLAVTFHLMLLLLLDPQCASLLPGLYTVSFSGVRGVSGAGPSEGSSETTKEEDVDKTNDNPIEEAGPVSEGDSATHPGGEQQEEVGETSVGAASGDEVSTPSNTDGADGAAGQPKEDTALPSSSSTTSPQSEPVVRRKERTERSPHGPSSSSSDSSKAERVGRGRQRGVPTPRGPMASSSESSGTERGVLRREQSAPPSFVRAGLTPATSSSRPPQAAGAADAKVLSAQVRQLLHRLPTKRGGGWFKRGKKASLELPLLASSVRFFLLPAPRRRTGFQELTSSYSTGAVNVIRYLTSRFPLTFKSALHGGATRVLSIDWSRSPVYSRGRLTFSAQFDGETQFPPVYLTVLFIEDGKQPGQDATALLHRVAAAQNVALKAGMKCAADVSQHLRTGTPFDAVPLSEEQVVDLEPALLSPHGVLEPRIWAPLPSLMRRIDQAQGTQGIRLAEQARASITWQMVKIVFGLRAEKLVLPRVVWEDFWVDEAGLLFYNPRDLTNLMSEGDPLLQFPARGQGEASQRTGGEAAQPEESLTPRSNSVALALAVMQIWCILPRELMTSRTPFLEKRAKLATLDFTWCTPGMPLEVKDLIALLHGGKTSDSIAAAEVTKSAPFTALQQRLDFLDTEERITSILQERQRVASWRRHRRGIPF